MRLAPVAAALLASACVPKEDTSTKSMTFVGTMAYDQTWEVSGTHCQRHLVAHATGNATCTVVGRGWPDMTCQSSGGQGTIEASEAGATGDRTYVQNPVPPTVTLGLEGSCFDGGAAGDIDCVFQGSVSAVYSTHWSGGDFDYGVSGGIPLSGALPAFDAQNPVFRYEATLTVQQGTATACQGDTGPRTDHVKLDLVLQP
jgi:hypothetical protein